MWFLHSLAVLAVIPNLVVSLQYPLNPTSDISEDEKNYVKDKKNAEDASGHEVETEFDDRDKTFLDEAMKAVLGPDTIIHKNNDIVETFKNHLDQIVKENITVDIFMDEMDNLSSEVCKTSQDALWSFVTDATSDEKKNEMVKIAAEDDDIKIMYWDVIKHHYWGEINSTASLTRSFRVIKDRSLSVLKPHSAGKQNVDKMQLMWSRVAVCAYNSGHCNDSDSTKTLTDIITIFKTSNNSQELLYYWKAFHDITGRRIRPVFKEYVDSVNQVANAEQFADAGEMMRFGFDDVNFATTVRTLWEEIKPLYDLIHKYTRNKLKKHYPDDIQNNDTYIPSHLLGNLWAQEWQAIYTKVTPYSEHHLPEIVKENGIKSKKLFDVIDDFYQSLGFESAKDSYADITEFKSQVNCLPSSHDMCDRVHYRIKWCGEEVTDIAVSLSRAARLLGHVQYFKEYRDLRIIFRDGPNPAFHDALADIVSIAASSPNFLHKLDFIRADTSREAKLNHLLWLSLEKIPLMAYAYILDTWRWDVFANAKASIHNWNQHWWNLRMEETGISPPVPRDEEVLDPVSKYHVVSHVQYITYFISTVLEFQILNSLCKDMNHTGPLHECDIYGVREAGNTLRRGMSYGASADWRTVLYSMIQEDKLSTEGILAYFEPLREFLTNDLVAAEAESSDMDNSVPVIVGAVLAVLIFVVIIVYCFKRHNIGGSVLALCGLSKNGSLDIAATDLGQNKNDDLVVGVTEAKV